MKASTLIVTDLDGTLVYDSKTVRAKDACAMKEIQRVAMTAIATGRSIKEIQYIEAQVGIDIDYYIAFNGAFAQDKTGKILIDKPMTCDTIQRLACLFTEYDIVFDALDGEARWGNFQHEKIETLWGMKFVSLDAPYDSLQHKQIYKVNVRPKLGEATYIVDLLAREIPEINAYQIGSSRIELVRKDVSKAAAILSCVHCEQRIIAIGDAMNDVEMFNVADMSYCIAHAPRVVQNQAQKIVPYFADAIYDFRAKSYGTQGNITYVHKH